MNCVRTFCIEPQNKIRAWKFCYFTSLCPIDTRPAIKFSGTPGISVGHYKTIKLLNAVNLALILCTMYIVHII